MDVYSFAKLLVGVFLCRDKVGIGLNSRWCSRQRWWMFVYLIPFFETNFVSAKSYGLTNEQSDVSRAPPNLFLVNRILY